MAQRIPASCSVFHAYNVGVMEATPAPQLTPLEVASHRVLGEAPSRLIDREEEPVEVLKAAIIEGAGDRPCYVSFSGGRDSSVVLAAATAALREAGLPDPVPITLRFKDIEATQESDWQQRVIDHLGLAQWEVVDITDELDVVGPYASRCLNQLGLLYPSNAYIHLPLFERVDDAVLMTGVDGDGLFGAWRWQRQSRIRKGLVKMRLKDVTGLAHSAIPGRVRSVIGHVDDPVDVAWLRQPARSDLTKVWIREVSMEPSRWDERVEWWSRRRYLPVALRSLDLVASLTGTRVVHPLVEGSFLGAVARRGGRVGLGGRTDALVALFGNLLPADVLTRTTKAVFSKVIWGENSRRLRTEWDGRGVDPDLIDIDALKREWAKDVPTFGSALLFQQVWLETLQGGA